MALVVPFWLNVKATLAISRDSLSERSQKVAQFLLVWLLPIIGAVVVLAVYRPKEKCSGRYPNDGDLLDGHLSEGAAMRRVGEAIDDD
jgi:hypothetical protein